MKENQKHYKETEVPLLLAGLHTQREDFEFGSDYLMAVMEELATKMRQDFRRTATPEEKEADRKRRFSRAQARTSDAIAKAFAAFSAADHAGNKEEAQRLLDEFIETMKAEWGIPDDDAPIVRPKGDF